MVTEDEKRLRASNAFLLQSFIVRAAVLQLLSPVRWKMGRKQNEASIFQGEMMTKVYRMDGVYQRMLRVLVEVLSGQLSIIYQHTSL